MKSRSPASTPTPTEPGDRSKGESRGNDNHREIRLFGRTLNLIVFVVHCNIALYAMCFFIQIGTLPYLSKKLGADPVVFGYLQTTFAVVQLLGGPLFGRFGDLYGGRAALTLAFSSAALSYGLTGMAVSVPLLFMARLPSVFMHAMQGGQMVVTDLCESSERTDALAKLGLSYGIGMIAGPLVGGKLTTNFGEETAAFIACAGSILSIIICLHYVPVRTKRPEVQRNEDRSSSAIFNVTKLLSLLKHPEAVLLLTVKLISGIPIGIFQSMFSVVAMDTFKLPADQNGFIMSYIGLLALVTQGVGVGFLAKRMSEMSIIRLAAFIMVWSYLLLAFVVDVFQLYVVLAPLCVGLTLMSVVIGSALTRTVSDADTGAMLGVNMAVNSMIRTVSPSVGGVMLNKFGFSSFGFLGCANSLMITLFLLIRGI